MYRVENIEKSLNVYWQDKLFIEGLTPVVCYDDGTQADIAFRAVETTNGKDSLGSYRQYTFKYGNQDDMQIIDISFKAYDNLLLASIYANFKFEVFKQNKLYRADGGVKLEVSGLGSLDGLMANYLYYNNWWTRPYFKKDIGQLPEHTQSLLWKSASTYYYLIPAVGDICRTEMRGNKSGMDILVSSNTGGCTKYDTTAFILCAGKDPFELAYKAIEAGFSVLGVTGQTREHRRYPEALEYLGWCTWDAFYHSVSAAGIVEKVEEFKKQDLPVKWVMIDDGWSELKDGKLASLKEDRSKFPGGLKELVEDLKVKYGVNWVGVWQNFLGYWGGIHPDSEITEDLKDSVYTANNGACIPAPDAGKGFKFWNAWHSYVKQQGIGFVKVDNQSSLLQYTKGNLPIGKAAHEAHAALEASLGINFDNCIINCMGMAIEELWNRPISAVSRNSDDFYPRKEGSFREHALQNAYNSFYHGNFMWGDWDMWWTQHEHAVNNAVLRAVSGGPVYTSDSVGKTDPELLWPLILSDGRILRCDRPGMAAADCLTINTNEETVPLKVWNVSGDAGLISTFNINLEGKIVEGTISPEDVPGLKGERFVIYDHFKKAAVFAGLKDKINVTLENNGVGLYIIIPCAGRYNSLGLINKYISPAAIKEQFELAGKTVVILKDGGIFGFTAETAPSKVLVDGVAASFSVTNGLYTVDCSGKKEQVIIEII